MSAGRAHRRQRQRAKIADAIRATEGLEPRFIAPAPGHYEMWMLGTVAFFLPSIPPGAPSAVAEAIARRRLAALRGECPCGARRRVTMGVGVPRLVFRHEAECPAADGHIAELARSTGWRWPA